MSRLAILIVLVSTLLPSEVLAEVECDLSPISRRVENKLPTSSARTIDSITLSFTEATITAPVGQGTVSADVLIPNLELSVPITSDIDHMKNVAKQKIAEHANDIDVTNLRFYDPKFEGNRVVVPGAFKAEKWWKTHGICCSGFFECRKCEWKTRTFERTVSFELSLAKIAVDSASITIMEQGATTSGGTAPMHQGASLDLKASATTRDDRSHLEKIVDFITGWIEAFAKMFGSNEEMQLGDFLGNMFKLDDRSIDPPSVANRRLEAFGFDSNLVASGRMRTYESRDAWEAFNAGMQFSADKTRFSRAKEALVLHYAFDYDEYRKVLSSSQLYKRRFRSTHSEHNSRVDILEKSLCAKMRPSFVTYIESLQRKFEGSDNLESRISYRNLRQLEVALSEKYGVSGTSALLFSRSKLLRRESAHTITTPPASLVQKSGFIAPAQGSLWALAQQNGWSANEVACAMKAAKRVSGNANLIYPLQSFEACASDVAHRQALNRLFEEIELRHGREIFTPYRASANPLAGKTHYRGWYYCYQNPSICAGRDRVTWWTDASKYGARGGTHKGMDLIHGEMNSTMQLRAAVDGQIIFHSSNPTGWGNALLIPFTKNQKQYLVVYAHLPSTARQFDGKRVRAGDSLGLAGCSGNAGDGKGNCNDYCGVQPNYAASDLHLHFEVVEKGAQNAVSIDPAAVVPFPVTPGPPRKIYVCQKKPTDAQTEV